MARLYNYLRMTWVAAVLAGLPLSAAAQTVREYDWDIVKVAFELGYVPGDLPVSNLTLTPGDVFTVVYVISVDTVGHVDTGEGEPTTFLDTCTDVTDANAPDPNLGTACIDEELPKEFRYAFDIAPTTSDCSGLFVENVATQTEADTGEQTQSAWFIDVEVQCLPVELTSFDVLTTGSNVILAWATASESNNAGFAVEQDIGPDIFGEIGFVEGSGTTNEPQEYSFAVNDVEPGLHRFRLKQIDFDGAFEYSPVVETAVTVPDRFLIEAAYPNPFNPTTTLRFAVAVEQRVDVTLLNSAGQSVRTLYSGSVKANEIQQLTVEAAMLPSGTYMVHFEGNGLSATERIVLVK